MSVQNLIVSPLRKFSKTLTLPGDKSISHRAVILGAIAKGKTEIRNFLSAEDCLHTLKAIEYLGVQATFQGTLSKVSQRGHFGKCPSEAQLTLHGRGLRGLHRPRRPIDLGNSGTSMRLLSGILAAQQFTTTLKGDASLSQRPMRRIILPLEEMGAKIVARDGNFPPLTIRGGSLQGIRYHLPIPSAQVKSAILLAGLYAEGETTVAQPFQTRDHTERMLRHFGKSVGLQDLTVSLEGGGELEGTIVEIPGDISSAVFFIVLASALKESRLIVQNVGLNPTRLGFVRVLKRMGAQITLIPKTPACEPMGDIEVRGGALHGTTVEAHEIPGLIDELPILMVAGACAEGRSLFRQASELRVKETDRIFSLVTNLRKMGISIWNELDDIVIQGGKPFYGSRLESFKDHRTAMSLAIAGCLAREGETTIRDAACIQTSLPNFEGLLKK